MKNAKGNNSRGWERREKGRKRKRYVKELKLIKRRVMLNYIKSLKEVQATIDVR